MEIEEELRIAPDDDKDELLAQYEVELDALENQKKIFEDLEFQQLEVSSHLFFRNAVIISGYFSTRLYGGY